MANWKSVVLAAVLTALTACTSTATGPEPLPDDDGAGTFVVTTHDAQTLDAELTSSLGSIHVLANVSGPDVIDVTFDFGDPVIAYRIDRGRGRGDFMPSGGALDTVDQRLLEQLVRELDALMPPDPATRWRLEDTVMRQATLLQIAPIGERLTADTFTAQQGWTHISCTCGTQYIGSGYYRQAGRGCGCNGGSGNGCKGRCGQGCGITSSPGCVGSTAYTQDCAKHDYGLGSFAAASDDYSFAGNNCSCSGVGTCY